MSSRAWNLFRWFPFAPGPLEVCFREIRGTRSPNHGTSIRRGLKHNPHLMLIDDADRPAKWYFGLKQAYLESRRTGETHEASDVWAGGVEVA
mgnify:CR=1 FL=1